MLKIYINTKSFRFPNKSVVLCCDTLNALKGDVGYMQPGNHEGVVSRKIVPTADYLALETTGGRSCGDSFPKSTPRNLLIIRYVSNICITRSVASRPDAMNTYFNYSLLLVILVGGGQGMASLTTPLNNSRAVW